MEAFKFLNYTVADALATITINRPPHNVLDIAVMEELNRALDIAAREESAKMLMITAAGEKVFSAGVDVMDQLAQVVDRPTAIAAANWSERKVAQMRAECSSGVAA